MTKENERNINDAGTEVQEAFLKYLQVCAANTDHPIHVYSMTLVMVNKLTGLALHAMSQVADKVNGAARQEGGAK